MKWNIISSAWIMRIINNRNEISKASNNHQNGEGIIISINKSKKMKKAMKMKKIIRKIMKNKIMKWKWNEEEERREENDNKMKNEEWKK